MQPLTIVRLERNICFAGECYEYGCVLAVHSRSWFRQQLLESTSTLLGIEVAWVLGGTFAPSKLEGASADSLP